MLCLFLDMIVLSYLFGHLCGEATGLLIIFGEGIQDGITLFLQNPLAEEIYLPNDRRGIFYVQMINLSY